MEHVIHMQNMIHDARNTTQKRRIPCIVLCVMCIVSYAISFIFAAHIKSLRESPLIACVISSTRTNL